FLGPIATGARFEPTSNTWVATTQIGAPPYRMDFAGVWTGREMIVWGGQFPDTDTGGRFCGLSPPAAPQNLSVMTVSTSTVDLSWTDLSSNESGFEVERKTGASGTWSRVLTTASNVS